jgi:predicted NBD/HSP70 family sugar kinase
MAKNQSKEILVIDIGGTSVKLWHTGHQEHRKFDSGKQLTPDAMVERTKATVEEWTFEAIALGLPCRVSAGRAVDEPQNLGAGWMGYNFSAAFGQPTRMMNDACLQALGSYDGCRMLFLGLGTAVGSALIADHLILSIDMGRLYVGAEKVYEILGDQGAERLGPKKWQKAVHEIVPSLQHAMMADYVVLGGGNAKEMTELPDGVRRGHNRAVVEGGRRLWEELPDPAKPNNSEWMIL